MVFCGKSSAVRDKNPDIPRVVLPDLDRKPRVGVNMELTVRRLSAAEEFAMNPELFSTRASRTCENHYVWMGFKYQL